MSKFHRNRLALGAVVVGFVVFGIVLRNSVKDLRSVVLADPTGIKYTGAGACAAAACHGAPTSKPTYDGDCGHNENTVWASKDLHAQAFSGGGGRRGLNNPQSKDIAKNLKIADARKSERCTSCHALSGMSTGEAKNRVNLKPSEIVPKGYAVEDGVSCDACHGPAQKYLEPHVDKQWTQKQRKALGSEKLYTEWGLFDTKNLKFRANTCVSCHLKIDHELLEAGHPGLPFELDGYSQGEWVHWRDKGAWFSTKAWSIGQVVSLREAALMLADRLKAKASAGLVLDSYKHTATHLLTTRQIAAVLDPAVGQTIEGQYQAINKEWENPAAVEATLRALGKTADQFADKLEAKSLDQATTEALLKNLVSEGEAAGTLGYRAAEQYTMGIKSLWSTMVRDAKPADGDAKMEKVDGLYEPLGEAQSYDAKVFIPAAKAMGQLFGGGKALGLLPGGPKLSTPLPAGTTPEKKPEPVATTPEKKPEPVATTPEKKPEPVATTPEKKPEPVATTPEKKPEPVAPDTTTPANSEDIYGKMLQLKKMFDAGLIDQLEYDAKRKELLKRL